MVAAFIVNGFGVIIKLAALLPASKLPSMLSATFAVTEYIPTLIGAVAFGIYPDPL